MRVHAIPLPRAYGYKEIEILKRGWTLVGLPFKWEVLLNLQDQSI